MVILLSAWALIAGGLQIFAAFAIPDSTADSILLGIGGAVAVIFGATVLFWPSLGVAALVVLAAFYAFSFGAAQIIWSFQLREKERTQITAQDRPRAAA
jgi:uncharacterized membrane protein HdeD (DUF308 family)